MAFIKEFLQSAKIAISSANSMIIIPRISLSSSVRLLITKLKKNGDVRLP